MTPSHQSRTDLLATMLRIRAYEGRIAPLMCRTTSRRCTSIGQEAGATGVVAALDRRDRILTSRCNAAHLLARGANAAHMFAAASGRSDDALQSSVHELGIVLTAEGSSLALAVVAGIALSRTMGQSEAGGIAVAFFCKEAACEGVFHESLNLASVWALPILFICEHDRSEGAATKRTSLSTEYISSWAQKFDIPAVVVAGNDVEAVHVAAQDAIAFIRRNGRPYFIELQTYRSSRVDHLESTASKQHDAVRLLSERLLRDNAISAAGIASLHQRTSDEINAAFEFAHDASWLSAAEADAYALRTEDIYVDHHIE